MNHVLLCIPSARGISPETVSCIWDMRTEVDKLGDKLHWATLGRMPLDLARNELVTAFLSTTAHMQMCMDDDVHLQDDASVRHMIDAVAAGCDIVSAPCTMRSDGGFPNVQPCGPIEVRGSRVVECDWTGFGCVMIARHVLEKMHAADQTERYKSTIMPDRVSAALFKSMVVPAAKLWEASDDSFVYLLDDRAFCLRAKELGFKIYAVLDVPTVHAGMAMNFAQLLERHERQLERAARGEVKLVDNTGKAIRR
jgi:hypothetical protein